MFDFEEEKIDIRKLELRDLPVKQYEQGHALLNVGDFTEEALKKGSFRIPTRRHEKPLELSFGSR